MQTPAATSGPAREPLPASSTPATKRRPKERSKRKSRAAVRRLRLARCLEDPESVGGPVCGEGFADDPVTWDGSPEAAVVARAAIVAHHEEMIRRNGYRIRQIALSAGRAGDGEVLIRGLPVDHRMPVLNGHGVARPRDYPLDEVDIGLLGRGFGAG